MSGQACFCLYSRHILPDMQHLAKIFSGTGSHYLTEKIAHQFGHPAGRVTIQRFSDGEIQPLQ
jgi:ribose-phosphate pyrophosphokinase